MTHPRRRFLKQMLALPLVAMAAVKLQEPASLIKAEEFDAALYAHARGGGGGSLFLYQQRVGRGLRIVMAPPPVIIDFAHNERRFLLRRLYEI